MNSENITNPESNSEQSGTQAENAFVEMAREVPSFEQHMRGAETTNPTEPHGPAEPAEPAETAGEAAEKKSWETKAELLPGEIKDFRDEILGASDEEARAILDRRIRYLQEQSRDFDGKIAPDRLAKNMHRGFIGENATISYEGGIASMSANYKMRDTDYIYQFFDTLRAGRENINSGRDVFNAIEAHLNSYFGIPSKNADRDSFIEQKLGLNNPDLDDDAYFALLDSIDISMFRDAHVAQCSERSAMAQNLLSVLGYETYYRCGSVNIDGVSEGHAFNIVADNTGAKNIMDYSVTSALRFRGTEYLMPTMRKIDDFDAFTSGKVNYRAGSFLYEIGDDGSRKRTLQKGLIYSAVV